MPSGPLNQYCTVMSASGTLCLDPTFAILPQHRQHGQKIDPDLVHWQPHWRFIWGTKSKCAAESNVLLHQPMQRRLILCLEVDGARTHRAKSTVKDGAYTPSARLVNSIGA